MIGNYQLNSKSVYSYTFSATGFSTNLAYSTNGSSNDTASFYDSPGNDTFYGYADYNNGGQQLGGMYGSYTLSNGTTLSYTSSASGFGTVVGEAVNGGTDTADLFGSSGQNTLNAQATIALLYGNNYYNDQAMGFATVNVFGAADGVNTYVKGPNPLTYQLKFSGTWGNG